MTPYREPGKVDPPQTRWWFDWKHALRIGPVAIVLVLAWNAFQGKVLERLPGNLIGVALCLLLICIRRRPL